MTENQMRYVIKHAINALSSIYLYQRWGEDQDNAIKNLQWALSQPLTPNEPQSLWRKRQRAPEFDDEPE